MIICKKASDIDRYLNEKRAAGLKTGFIPTMGALHEGHLHLINAARGQNDLTICSIFVNPTQFNDPADFAKYPVSTEQDILVLEQAGTDVLFLPAVDVLYPGGLQQLEHYELGALETRLEGQYRPGHFQGVCQVMQRLLSLVRPDRLYMGQKDFQQCLVVKKLLQLMGLQTEFQAVPTVREADGLAMSSRNRRLTSDQRSVAPTIYKTLQSLNSNLRPGSMVKLQTEAAAQLERAGFSVDYVSIASRDQLEPVTEWDGALPLVALVAAFLQPVRLIDNLLLG